MHVLASSLGAQIACKMAAAQAHRQVQSARDAARQTPALPIAVVPHMKRSLTTPGLAPAASCRFASLLLCGAAQGWQLALAALVRRPLVSAAMVAGQLPGLHALATWALLHHLFSNQWLRQPARSTANKVGKQDGCSA